ncbi:MAG: hypothetical protein ThorAB25_01110 [Candidatus Thorarchaeota archaeon AB_25]|nr:MAG: hypothetical protein ThorAB25_01110 [Candidatus Thorarchaeota archaeon AB_25]
MALVDKPSEGTISIPEKLALHAQTILRSTNS